MAVEVVVPELGHGETHGVVAEWYVADGATVTKGEAVYRYECDFVAVDVEAESDGVIEHLLGAGGAYAPGAVVAVILGGDPEPELVPEAEPQRPDEPPLPLPAVMATGAATAWLPVSEDEAAREVEVEVPLDEVPIVSGEEPADEGSAWGSAMASWAHSKSDDRTLARELEKGAMARDRLQDEHALDARESDAEPEETPAVEPQLLPGLRRGTLHVEPPPSYSAWDAVEGDQEEMFGFVAPEETNPRPNAGTSGFGLTRKPRRHDPEEGEAAAEFAAEGEYATEEDESTDAPEINWDTFEAPVKDVGEPVFEEEPPPANDPIPFPALVPVATPGYASGPATTMTLNTTVRMAEARRLRERLSQEWRQTLRPPTDEAIVLRAFAKAVVEQKALRILGDDAGLVMLEEDGEWIATVQGAARLPFREVATTMETVLDSRIERPCSYALTSFSAFGINEGTPVLTPGQPFALGMGASHGVREGEELIPVPVMTLTLSYSLELMTVTQAARLLSRVRELLETAHALVTD
jgi:pyruvate/2-oxoglutarate dehydrogenase complex dihydrolipoamide acyltransferase (E2) component